MTDSDQRRTIFLYEHPAHATSRKTDIIEGMMSDPEVARVVGNHCMYGSEADVGSLVKETDGREGFALS